MGHLYIMDSTRADCIKPGFGRFRSREKNEECTPACQTLSPLLCAQHIETGPWHRNSIIPRKISIIPPKVSPTSRGKAPKAPSLWRILRRDWRDRTRYRYDIMIGETQRGGEGDSISRRIRGQEKVKNVGRISKTVRNTSMVLHHLLQVMQDSKVKGKLTRMVIERRGKPKLVMNIELSKDGDPRQGIEEQNVLHFGSQIAKEFTIIRGVRGEINSTDKFSKRMTCKSKPDGEKLERFKSVSIRAC